MDIILLLKSAFMGIVEGLTEFLPVSSTGHLILAGSLIDFTGEIAKVFEIAIQTGAMFAVIWEYRARVASTFAGLSSDRVAQRFALNLVIAFLPAAFIGLLVGGFIKRHLFSAVPVAAAFIIGGLIILWVERKPAGSNGGEAAAGGRRPRVDSVDQMTPLDALKVGFMQCLALIPGTSRSGATIIGGMVLGLSRKCATEFSFYLGIPTLIAAGAYSLFKERSALHASDLPVFAVGTFFAFASALLCIRWLIRYISTHDFRLFAWYRIVFGGVILLTAFTGLVQWVD